MLVCKHHPPGVHVNTFGTFNRLPLECTNSLIDTLLDTNADALRTANIVSLSFVLQVIGTREHPNDLFTFLKVVR